MSYLRTILLSVLTLLMAIPAADAQNRRIRGRDKGSTGLYVPIYRDTTNKIDSAMLARRDSLRVVDSLRRIDSTALMTQSSIQMPAFSACKDSLKESFRDGHQILYYYGDVKVTYGTMELTADYMEYDVQDQSVFARGTIDPATGELKGNPVMKDNGKTYEMKELTYNFGTKKAFIRNMVTTESEGILRGNSIKMMPDQSINLTNGKYTVCDCEEPHYYLHLTAAKVMTKPTRNTVFGPAWPVVEGVPMFPIVLPFGFIPKRPDRASGLLMPTFGEEDARGFFLRDAGMYFVFGDYIDLSVTGDYFTRGSWALNVNSRYKVNYKCNGNVSINYSYDQTGDKGEPDFFSTSNFGVKWSHQQDSKAHPGATFSASVNFSSPSNSRYNSRSVTEALNNQASSSVSYSRNWNGKFNLSLNATHSQNSRDSSYALTLPNVTFSVSKFYPFKRKVRVGKEKLYEKFSLSYNTTWQNKMNFKASEFNWGTLFSDKLQSGMQHSFSIGLPNFTLFKYINVNPSVSYGMNWFFDKTEKYYDSETQKVEDKKGGMFSTLGITQNYSGSLSLDTQIYGMYMFAPHCKVQAIRHIVKPSVSFSFSPEKGKYFNGWRTLEYTDAQGNAKTMDYNIYAGQMYSPPGKGRSATASISIGNNLEAKVRDYRDTTGTGMKKVKILDQCNFNTGYNFLADSLKMSNVGVSISTNIFGKVGISGNLNFDPYAINERGQKINKFNISATGVPLRLTNASLSMSYSLSGEGKINGNDGSKSSSGGSGGKSSMPAYQRIYYHPVTGEYIPGGWVYYMNPNSPWSINLSYSLNYSKSYQYTNEQLITKHNVTQTLNVNGNLKLTPALSLQMTSGLDIMAFKITTTQMSATYDLHCFKISFNWVPTGTWKQWNFLICANAAALSDLLRFRKSSSMWDR